MLFVVCGLSLLANSLCLFVSVVNCCLSLLFVRCVLFVVDVDDGVVVGC